MSIFDSKIKRRAAIMWAVSFLFLIYTVSPVILFITSIVLAINESFTLATVLMLIAFIIQLTSDITFNIFTSFYNSFLVKALKDCESEINK